MNRRVLTNLTACFCAAAALRARDDEYENYENIVTLAIPRRERMNADHVGNFPTQHDAQPAPDVRDR